MNDYKYIEFLTWRYPYSPSYRIQNPDIREFRNLLKRSLTDKQNACFETVERDDLLYIFKEERLKHKEAVGLKKEYPENVKIALGDIYNEYIEEYQRLVKLSWNSYPKSLNKRWKIIIPFIQIDMVYLPESFLEAIKNCNPWFIKEVIKPFIFEIESSVAYYELLSKIWTRIWIKNSDNQWWFANWFHELLDNIRSNTWKKISLLVTSKSKYKSIKEFEFWIAASDILNDADVREKSGFDSIIWPDEFINYFRRKVSDTLFYVRSSTDASELKSWSMEGTDNLIDNEEYRTFIRSYSITTNIDEPGSAFPINDTKKYMKNMGLWFLFDSIESIISEEAIDYIKQWKDFSKFTGRFYTKELEKYLFAIWVDESMIKKGEITFRCKPVEWSYGAYGHVRLKIQDAKSRRKLRDSMIWKWQYILQVEHLAPLLVNTSNGKEYRWIDRIFMSMDRDGRIKFMQWFTNIIPADNDEAKKNNIHWSRFTEYWIIY